MNALVVPYFGENVGEQSCVNNEVMHLIVGIMTFCYG